MLLFLDCHVLPKPVKIIQRIMLMAGFLLIGAAQVSAHERADFNFEKFAPITGRISDARTGEPIVGASIQVKGTTIGTTSNVRGEFTIAANPGQMLVITFVGYARQEVAVGASTNLEVRLMVTNESMKEAVVTGRFTRKASTATGVVSTFTQAEIQKAGTTNVIQSLKNLEPAFFLPENNLVGSNPNVLPDIQIRGQTGLPDVRGQYISNPNNPLFILDGFPVSLQTIVDLDINRIQSATLLMDAASKAIYGSRAANGVLVIETKAPKAGKLFLSYTTNIRLSAADLSSYDLTDAAEKLEVEVAAGLYTSNSANPGANNYILQQKYNEYLTNVVAGVNTDWLSKPVRNGIGQQHSLTMEGGEARGMRYAATFRYYDQKGVMRGSDRKTITGALKLSYRIKSFNFSNTFTVNDNKANNSPWGSFSQYVVMNPYLPYVDANGNILKTITSVTRQNGVAGFSIGAPTGTQVNENVFNPAYNSTLKIIDASKYTQFINNFQIDWWITPELRVNGGFSVDKTINQADIFMPAEHLMFTTSEFSGDNSFRKGRYTQRYGQALAYAGNFTASYVKNINRHSINVNLPLGLSENRANSLTYIVEGIPNDRVIYPSMALQYYTAAGTRPIGSENKIRRVESAISANYSYDDRYFFDVTGGKSKGTDAGPEVPWRTNWSVGLGWNLHNEQFFGKRFPFIDRLKVAANTGYVGADGFTSYDALSTYAYITGASYGVFGNGAALLGLANPLLVPQRTQEHSALVQFSIFKKLSGYFSYYIRNTEGLMTDITTAPSLGFTTYRANIGRTQNKGFNASLSYNVFYNARNGNALTLFAGVAHNTNKIVDVDNSFKSYNTAQDALSTRSPRTRFIEGQSLTTIWAVPSLGIDPATGREVYRKQDGTQTYTWSAADQIAAGDALPKYNGNFGFRVMFKGVELNTIFNYRYGGQQYNQTLVDRVENANLYQNVDRRVFTDRWRKPGDVSYFKNVADFSITQASTRFVEDLSTISLGSFDVGYDLINNVKKLKSMGFSRFRLGFTSTETFVWSTVRVERGIDYPFARDFTFNLNVSF